MYLAIVMDLHSRQIIGKRMTTALVERALQMAITLRVSGKGLISHSDRGSQYTSKRYGKLLKRHNIQVSMSGVGACWDKAVIERSF